jgi:hypothetical protein
MGCLLYVTWPTRPSLRFDGIEIRGTGHFKDHVVRALTSLKTKAPEAYATVTNNIGAIVQSAHTGMAAFENPPTSYLHDKLPWESVEAYASGIAHESLHSKLFHDRLRELSGSAEVPEEAWTGEAAEKLCCQYQARVLKAIGGSPSEIAYYGWDPNRDPTNRYWEIPYEKRDW